MERPEVENIEISISPGYVDESKKTTTVTVVYTGGQSESYPEEERDSEMGESYPYEAMEWVISAIRAKTHNLAVAHVPLGNGTKGLEVSGDGAKPLIVLEVLQEKGYITPEQAEEARSKFGQLQGAVGTIKEIIAKGPGRGGGSPNRG